LSHCFGLIITAIYLSMNIGRLLLYSKPSYNSQAMCPNIRSENGDILLPDLAVFQSIGPGSVHPQFGSSTHYTSEPVSQWSENIGRKNRSFTDSTPSCVVV